GAGHVRGLVAQYDSHAQRLEPPRGVARLEVRSLHRVAQVRQHFGDPAHATAADADEVDGVDAAHAVLHAAPPATATQASASRSSASMIAVRRAACAIASNLGRPASSSSRSRAASETGVSVGSGINTAAPASTAYAA